jgi:hypothetical protein
MDSYRAEKKATLAIALPDTDAEIEPVPISGGGRKPEPESDFEDDATPAKGRRIRMFATLEEALSDFSKNASGLTTIRSRFIPSTVMNSGVCG